MKLKEKPESLSKIDAIERYITLNQVGSFINFMEDAIREVDDAEITEKFNELVFIIQSKRKALSEMEI